MYCRGCRRETFYRRINRSGWLQRVFLSEVLGLYPWECVQCRQARFLRNAGKRPENVDPRGYIEP